MLHTRLKSKSFFLVLQLLAILKEDGQDVRNRMCLNAMSVFLAL